MSDHQFSYCLNTSTIRSKGASVLEYIDIAADAGYEGIEPWVQEIDAWVADGGTLEQIRERAESRSLHIVNVIAFFEWAVPEENRRTKALDEAKRCFDMAEILGSTFVAAAPSGIHDRKVDPFSVAERFATLTDTVAGYSATPLLEFWGVAKTLGTTGEVLLVAAESGLSDVKMLADVFHMYKGSGHHTGFEHFGPERLGLVHVNDYPAAPNRAAIQDEHRVYPGDGIAPWDQIAVDLKKLNYQGMLSLELFNPSYWAEGPIAVAQKGIEKLKACIER